MYQLGVTLIARSVCVRKDWRILFRLQSTYLTKGANVEQEKKHIHE